MGRKLLALRPNCCHHAVNRSPASETAENDAKARYFFAGAVAGG